MLRVLRTEMESMTRVERMLAKTFLKNQICLDSPEIEATRKKQKNTIH